MKPRSLILLMLSLTMGKLLSQPTPDQGRIGWITLDPGHFHAALVQKSMHPSISSKVHVYGPVGTDLDLHLARIKAYNQRQNEPTSWVQEVYRGPDFLERMLTEKKGEVVMLAGNNRLKTNYIAKAIRAGFHVFADKPMAIDRRGYRMLEKTFREAGEKKLLLYDIMTERYEITSILQKAFAGYADVFGQLEVGTTQEPAVVKESIHHFYKEVSGSPLQRPGWFYDVRQEGDGVVDVTTHLIDLVQWSCFPEQKLDYDRDIRLDAARRWSTHISPGEFSTSTRLDHIPDYLKGVQASDGNLAIFSNGQIDYRIFGHAARVKVTWAWQAEPGGGDTHFSLMRGSLAHLIIRQGKEQGYRPEFSIESAHFKEASYRESFDRAFREIASVCPGLSYRLIGKEALIDIPLTCREGHEAHFARVTAKFLDYLSLRTLPAWEIPGMLTKYRLTTEALELARRKMP